jgi:hypothetical protein
MPRFKTFKIDAVLVEHGLSVLRLPPYHPDLHPIELIWASVKEYIARKNVSFRPDDATKLAEEKFNIIMKEEWSSRCNNAHQCKQNYLQLEPIVDDISEQIVVNLQNDSDTSSCSSSEEEEEEIAKEDDGELSGTSSVKCSPATRGNSICIYVFLLGSREKVLSLRARLPLTDSAVILPPAHLTAHVLLTVIYYLNMRKYVN